MIHDLLGAGQCHGDADVLIIGAGTVGLVLASRLAAQGLRVICLESGGREQATETHPLNVVEQAGTQYAGAEHGRFRCLGGSSTRWGGALIPFQPEDMAPRLWPLDWAALSPYLAEAEALFGLSDGPYDVPDMLTGTEHVARLAKWPPFARRNVYSLLRERIEAPSGPDVWTNATATGFLIKNGKLAEVEARASDGSRIRVRMTRTVIAAGAIESTRILHLIDRESAGAISALTGTLGQGFQDHLSTVVATLDVMDRRELNKLLGFRFSRGGGMRNMRFELAPDSPLRHDEPACFAHVGFSDSGGGFGALRDIFRALQRRRLPDVKEVARLIRGLPWLSRAVWWRFVHKRLLYPESSALELHMVIEQERSSIHRISLSDRAADVFGMPLAKIDWRVTEADIANMMRATETMFESWQNSPLSELATLCRRNPVAIADDLARGGGIYHPTGSTRMADNAKGGVVDPQLRVFAFPDISVCSTSVLPTGGGANPTMMLILLALRCADGLVIDHRAGIAA